MSCIRGERELDLSQGDPQDGKVLYVHHRTATSLLLAIEMACVLCSKVWQHFSPDDKALLAVMSDEDSLRLPHSDLTDEPFTTCMIFPSRVTEDDAFIVSPSTSWSWVTDVRRRYHGSLRDAVEQAVRMEFKASSSK